MDSGIKKIVYNQKTSAGNNAQRHTIKFFLGSFIIQRSKITIPQIKRPRKARPFDLNLDIQTVHQFIDGLFLAVADACYGSGGWLFQAAAFRFLDAKVHAGIVAHADDAGQRADGFGGRARPSHLR